MNYHLLSWLVVIHYDTRTGTGTVHMKENSPQDYIWTIIALYPGVNVQKLALSYFSLFMYFNQHFHNRIKARMAIPWGLVSKGSWPSEIPDGWLKKTIHYQLYVWRTL